MSEEDKSNVLKCFTLFDGVVAVAVGVVGHVSQQGVVRVGMLGVQAVGVRSRVRAAAPRELAWKT